MTREKAREATVDTRDLDYQIGVMQAFKARRQIEFRFRDTFSKAWHASVFPNWNWQHLEYRIKPTKTLRPWTKDEVPLGAWLRHSGQGRKAIIIDVTFDQQIGIHGSYFSPQFVLAYCEHSLDGGKTWLPCGVEEESQ